MSKKRKNMNFSTFVDFYPVSLLWFPNVTKFVQIDHIFWKSIPRANFSVKIRTQAIQVIYLWWHKLG